MKRHDSAPAQPVHPVHAHAYSNACKGITAPLAQELQALLLAQALEQCYGKDKVPALLGVLAHLSLDPGQASVAAAQLLGVYQRPDYADATSLYDCQTGKWALVREYLPIPDAMRISYAVYTERERWYASAADADTDQGGVWMRTLDTQEREIKRLTGVVVPVRDFSHFEEELVSCADVLSAEEAALRKADKLSWERRRCRWAWAEPEQGQEQEQEAQLPC
jgi:hypothetical protein